MRLPLRLVRNGVRSLSGSGETRNLSSGGVLFMSDTSLDVGEAIEYVIHLMPVGSERVTLHCLGKVTRARDCGPVAPTPGPSFEVAATLERYEFVRPHF